MPDAGVYVIQETDRALLYVNKHARDVSPQASPGIPCHQVWSGSCDCCPLTAIGSRPQNRTVSYNAAYGGIVDLTASRITWDGGIPAFVVTVIPRRESTGYAYRKILYADLSRDRCKVLKSDPEGWQPGRGSLSRQLAAFAASGAIHPEDAGRFTAFTSLEHMRTPPPPGQEALTITYRRMTGEKYRWNLMELFPDTTNGGKSAILCVKDVHDVLREGLEREGLTIRAQELIRSLGEPNAYIYTIDLQSGAADPIRIDGQMQEGRDPEPWDALMSAQIEHRLHEAYLDEFQCRFSLEGLRRLQDEGQQKTELLCQWSSGGDYRYISVTAYLNRGSDGSKHYTILALQDVDDRMRQELARSKRDMQMSTILRTRFKILNTVDLESGACERIDLSKPFGPENTLTGDYNAFIQNALGRFVCPEDADHYWSLLSLSHLRETAASITDEYYEEVCQYRLRGERPCWIELRIIYSPRRGQSMVYILGQDITREKKQEQTSLQALEDRSHIISSLSSLFFSTYYMDLEHDTFRAVTQLRRISDLLGEEVNCTSALQIYANHFIHPDDRAEYLKVMNVENLRQALRWWTPCVAVEYRKLPDPLLGESGETSWVRATAILARTGPDDMPKTAVYVAQDISGSRRRG